MRNIDLDIMGFVKKGVFAVSVVAEGRMSPRIALNTSYSVVTASFDASGFHGYDAMDIMPIAAKEALDRSGLMPRLIPTTSLPGAEFEERDHLYTMFVTQPQFAALPNIIRAVGSGDGIPLPVPCMRCGHVRATGTCPVCDDVRWMRFVECIPKSIVDAMKETKQDPVHHPEGNVLVHTILSVRNSLPRHEHLAYAAAFHDTGKTRGSHGHERRSVVDAMKAIPYIDDPDLDPGMTLSVIGNHMRMHAYMSGSMVKKAKRAAIEGDRYFTEMLDFAHIDSAAKHLIHM